MSLAPEELRRARAEANTRGRRLEAAGRLDDAMAAYRDALGLDPAYVPAASNLARLLVAREEARDAVALLERIAAGASFDPGLAVNYANALLGMGRAVEAEQRLRGVLGTPAAPPQAYNSLGTALYVQRQFAAAADAFAAAIRAAPEFAEAHENLAQVLLHRGEYAAAWPEYEWRWKNPSNALTKRVFDQPLWDGRPLAGRTLLLHAEQGLGDTIQFARFAARVPKDQGRIILACQEALVPLMCGLAGVDEVRVLGDALPAFDCHAPLLSLPGLFGTTRATIPDPSPYLAAEPDPEFAALRGLKIGVAWAGRARHADDPRRNRNCAAAQFTRLARAGVRLYSLQLGTDAPPPIATLGARVDGFAPTARVIAALDLVIGVDTSLVHLAGALAKPTWVLLPFAPDWRWTEDPAGRSPWYRTVRLFRQSAPGDWDGVFDTVAAALEAENPSPHA